MLDPQTANQLYLFAGLVIFGALLVSGGVLFGVHISRGNQPGREAEEVRVQHFLEMIGGLSNWTQGFAGDVNQYGTHLKNLLTQVEESGALNKDSKSKNLLSELMQANEQLKQRLQSAEESLADKAKEVEDYLSQARTDQLTKLPNRRAFDDEFARRFAQWQRYSTPLSLVIIDIDHFKSFNDNYGHLVGDTVLREVGQLLNRTARDSDMLVRFGGEEFAVILPCSSVAEAGQAAVRLCEATERFVVVHEEQEFNVTISAGAAQVIGGDSIMSLIKRADEALYAAKEAGRNRAFYHDGIHAQPVGSDEPMLAEEVRGGIPTRFNQVCDGLRDRLIEVTQS